MEVQTMSETARKEFISKLKHQLDELDARMDKVEQKSRELEGDARKTYEKNLELLRGERVKAAAKLDEVLNAGEEKWDDLKDEAEHAWKALNNSINYFKSHFR
jgi:septal ring factor EnvC (AmiA/AmiB activator)